MANFDYLLLPDITTFSCPPAELIRVSPDEDGTPLPEEFRGRVMVDVIHDGNNIPEEFLRDDDGCSFDLGDKLNHHFFVERDWGAELVAACLSSALHLEGYHRINLARALLDFARFPGSTPKAADFMSRFAINYPFSKYLSYQQKMKVLENHYDAISDYMDGIIRDKLVKIAVHTYDELNPSATRRPAVSVLTRSYGHQRDFEIPVGLFDPLFPSEFAAVTAERILSSRIELKLEETAIHVADNYPYALPDGSVEVRFQVWSFFDHLKRYFEAAFPQAEHDERLETTPRDMVWHMLLDTNLRSAQSDSLRSYLHMYRRPPDGREQLFQQARTEYQHITQFLWQNYHELVVRFRSSVERPSALAIEVRKDLVYDFDGSRPLRPRTHDAQLIARVIASAIQEYFQFDRQAKASAQLLQDPRYF